MNLGSILPAAVGTVLADAVAVAVAFGAPLTGDQQHLLLVFAGSVTTLIFTVISAVHVHTVHTAAKIIAPTPPPTAVSPVVPAQTPGGGGG